MGTQKRDPNFDNHPLLGSAAPAEPVKPGAADLTSLMPVRWLYAPNAG